MKKHEGIIYLVEFILMIVSIYYIVHFYGVKLLGAFLLFGWYNNFAMFRYLDKKEQK